MLTPIMFVVKNTPLYGFEEHYEKLFVEVFGTSIIGKGWGNGYVAVFKGHPWYGVDMESLDIESDSPITFSTEFYIKHPHKLRSSLKKCWVIGFDTRHAGDSLQNWPKERVVDNTLEILVQAIEMQREVQPYKSNKRKH